MSERLVHEAEFVQMLANPAYLACTTYSDTNTLTNV
jgi:hypothetical protein